VQSSLAGPAQSRRTPQRHDVLIDSLFTQPHEQYLKKLYDRTPHPQQLMPRSSSEAATSYPNIDLSNQTAPQNEPSVKISRADPQSMLAAWRDFSTGVSPAIRRIGYSY